MQSLVKKWILLFIIWVYISGCTHKGKDNIDQIVKKDIIESIQSGSITEEASDINDKMSYFSSWVNTIKMMNFYSWKVMETDQEVETLWTIFDTSSIDDNPILINDLLTRNLILMSKTGKILYDWPVGIRGFWNDIILLPDGKLLATFKAKINSSIPGWFGGVIELIDKTGKAIWNYNLADGNTILHHDVEILPNGNILALVWDKVRGTEYGYKLDVDIYLERIIEIDPKNNTIVWEWKSVDHMIQDTDPKIANFGNIAASPERIDINYAQSQSGMVMHANGLVYDPVNDLIYVSIYQFSEVWAIDHSTTPEEVRGNTGGVYGRGWNIVYRFGNPSAYGWTGSRIFYSTHHPSFTSSGNFLIYSNWVGAVPEQSTVYELAIPQEINKKQPTLRMPEIIWSYTNPEIYSDKVGWAVRLANGNTLITEGDGHIWEVTPEKKLVWKYSQKPAMFWRTYSYDYDSEEIQNLWILSDQETN